MTDDVIIGINKTMKNLQHTDKIIHSGATSQEMEKVGQTPVQVSIHDGYGLH